MTVKYNEGAQTKVKVMLYWRKEGQDDRQKKENEYSYTNPDWRVTLNEVSGLIDRLFLQYRCYKHLCI